MNKCTNTYPLPVGLKLAFAKQGYSIKKEAVSLINEAVFYKTKFIPADAGQLNFYLNVLGEKIKLPHENFNIGIILSKKKK